MKSRVDKRLYILLRLVRTKVLFLSPVFNIYDNYPICIAEMLYYFAEFVFSGRCLMKVEITGGGVRTYRPSKSRLAKAVAEELV